MKIGYTVARILLGLLFVVFGLNGFLNFIPMGPMPTGPAGQFAGSMMQTHYMSVVFLFELTGGALLLLTRYHTLALALLAPVIVNILMYHAFMLPSGFPPAIVVTILWLIAAYRVRSNFAPLLQPAS